MRRPFLSRPSSPLSSYREFISICGNLDNVLLSWQRNGLICTIAGIGVVSYRTKESRSTTQSKPPTKPVSGICLLGKK